MEPVRKMFSKFDGQFMKWSRVSFCVPPSTVLAVTLKVTTTCGPAWLWQSDGTTKPFAPQPAGIVPFLAMNAVKAETYDHVRSVALTGVPLVLSYCSASAPLLGVYLAFTAIKPSAKSLMAPVRLVKVCDDDPYVPGAAEVENCLKKGNEMSVICREPWDFQTMSAS